MSNVGTPQTQPRPTRAQAAAPSSAVHGKACKEFSFQLPVELLRAIFEEYLRLDLPVQVLLEANSPRRIVALETQSLWRRLLLSADAIPDFLRAGSVHACASEGQATRILNRSGIITKLEVTFVLGPKEGDNSNPETGRDAARQPIYIPSYLSGEWKEPDFWGWWNQKRPPNLHESLARMVVRGARPTISDFCIVFATDIAPSFANSCPHVNFVSCLARLGSLLVPGVPALNGVDKLLIITADSIHAFFPCLKYQCLKNDVEDSHASIQYLSPSPIQIANRDGPNSISQDRSSYAHAFGPPIILSQRIAIRGLIAHIDTICDTIITVPKLLFGRIALGNFGNTRFAGLQGLAIDGIQGTHSPLTPPLGTFHLPVLKALQTAPIKPDIARFDFLQLDDRALAILAPNPKQADAMIKPVTDEGGRKVRPRHLKLMGPLHDAHLTHALKLLSENLTGLKQGSLILSMKNGPLCLNTPPANPPQEPVQPTDDPVPKLDADEVEGFQPVMANIPQFLHNDHVDPISSIAGTGVVGESVATSAVNSTVVNAAEVPNLSGQVLILQRKAIFVGTYSKVYVGMLGTHQVAVKMLRLVKSRRATKRKFRRELFISWHLRHPNILPLYGYSEYDDGEDMSYALVLKWADGGSAAHYIYSRDLSWNQCTRLVHNVVDGLRYLHAFNPPIIHADLKPLNVLIDKDGVAQIGDFGISRLMEDDVDTGMTTTTPHFGTVRYLAPELVDPGKAVPSRATDIWALGCVAYEFIYRARPYANIDVSWRISQAIDEGVPPAERPMIAREDIPVLWSLLELCWSTDPDTRPTAEDFFQTFDQNRNSITNALRTLYGDLSGPMDDSSTPRLWSHGQMN